MLSNGGPYKVLIDGGPMNYNPHKSKRNGDTFTCRYVLHVSNARNRIIYGKIDKVGVLQNVR